MLEKVAKAIHDKDSAEYILWDDLMDFAKEIYTEQAQAAIDALDIIILPKDAEPQLSDIVLYEGEVGKIWTIDEYNEVMDVKLLSGEFVDIGFKSIDKIIFRNKPVITEEL